MRGPFAAFCLAFFLLLLAGSSGSVAAEAAPPEGRLLRFPDIHRDFVVFVYAGDIWRAPSAGGPARRLTSHEGLELFPKISRDGRWVAYSAEYTGSRQVYVMPSSGGPPKQLTFYTDVGAMPPRGGFDYWIQGWTPEGKILVRMNRLPWGRRMGRYFLVDPEGGLEVPLPLPHGGSASYSPDGKRLAYCPVDREFRTWKRTRGGRAQDIWIYDLERNRSERITTFEGTDNFPLWSGDTIHFTSDRDETLNLFAYEIRTGEIRKVTDHDEYDVLWPSLGPGAIVYMNGGYLYRFDLGSSKAERIPITIGSDLPGRVPSFEDVSGNIASADISPSGARALFDARGDLFTVPAEHGPTRNLTNTQGVRERSPAWSPDGKSIAYVSDETGEYEIYVMQRDGSGEPRQVTRNAEIWRFAPSWSPDSKHLAFGDRGRRLWVLEVDSGEATEVDRNTLGDITTYVWSPDSRWIAYVKNHPTRLQGIGIYSVEERKAYMLGDGLTGDTSPAFSADGKHLFFLSNRDYNLTFSAYEFNYLYTRATRIYATALDPNAPPLFPPRSDEESPKKEEKAGEKEEREGEKPEDEGKEEAPPLVVEPEGFVARTIALPGLSSGDYSALSATEGAVYYRRAGDNPRPDLYRYDLKEREEKKVLDDVTSYVLSRDGKKLLYRDGTNWGIADAKAGLKAGDGRLDLSGLMVKLDPMAEWRQIYRDSWRILRDWFYDPGMHGTDWRGLGERYGQMLPHLAHRADLDFLIGELASELEVGHTYVQSGDQPTTPRIQGGMLGCEFEADGSGRYRISRIFVGENWDPAYRSPLTEPGVGVQEGEFLIAIDGTELATRDNPYRLLENKANRPVVLKVASRPDGKEAREVTVIPIASELNLRYIDWVRSRMAMVERLSGGKIGYLHLPNTAGAGNRMVQKLFYAQAVKPALIIDERFNGGGFIPDRMIEYFTRKPLSYWARREIGSIRTPGFAHDGPKAMLMNGYSSSGGDALPYYFKKRGLGTLIGTRTWGGLVGLSGNPSFVDGGAILVPTFRIYDAEGRWVVENEGVSPDIEVFDLPEELLQGRDPSIDKAVELLLEELRRNPPVVPEPPKPPDMSR
jgi:tricorn protease